MYLKRYIHNDGQFKVAIIDTTEIGRRAFTELMPTPIGLQLLTQAMAGCLLLTANIKDEGTLQFQWRGDGPLKEITVEANTAGDVRGFVGAAVDFEYDPAKGLLGQAIGNGSLKVRRRIMPSKRIFESVVTLNEQELSLSLARYLLESQQVRAGITLGAKLDADLGIAGAGGVLVEAMPSVDDNLLFVIEDRLASMPPVSDFFSQSDGHDRLYEYLLSDLNVKLLEDSGVRYYCPCSHKRILQSLATLAVNELKEMREENKTFEIKCSFCNKSYKCIPEDLDAIVEYKTE